MAKSKRSRDYLGGMLMAAIGLAAAFRGSHYEMGALSRMGPGYFPTALGAILALVGVAIAVSARLARYDGELEVRAPEWRGWLCIVAALVAFVTLGKYGGLVPATFAVVFISALGDRQNGVAAAAALALASVAIAVVVFWWALQLQFPLFHWGN